MLRSLILAITNRPLVRKIATGRAGRMVARRFVAGEDIEDALKVVKALNERGMTASLDYLGENVRDLAAAHAAAATYRNVIERTEAAGLRANLSMKLTQMGLDLDPELAIGNAALVIARAVEADSSVTLDMEDHRYTAQTIDTCLRLADRYDRRVGVAVQTYLFRTPADVERLIDARVHVRLCKGAYRESRKIAYHTKADVDRAYARLLVRLLTAGAYPMIATHDERLINFAKRNVEILKRDRNTFEFQFLYGVRRDLQEQLVREGYRVRVYVPFGTEWYPYFMRRIAERPANVKFFLRQLVSR
jgi:proline dehydrogenase